MSFFSSILRQKKILVFVVFIFFILGTFMPVVAHAGIWDDLTGSIEDGWGEIAQAGVSVIGYAGKFLVGVCFAVEALTAKLLNGVLAADSVQEAVTKKGVVIEGWTVVRDFANMFIVLGFVVVGIATILRVREYEAQKLLPSLIIVAILINFSLLICGLIIDGSNIAMNYFLRPPISQGTTTLTNILGGSATNPLILKAIDMTLNGGTGTGETTDWAAFGAVVAGACLYAIIAALLFLIYAALFLFRQAALMCLAILSPLAFVCFVFPATKQIWSKWWSQFTQWALVGVPACFFIWLGSQLIGAGTLSTGTAIGKDGLIIDPLAFFIPACFMYFAYTLTFQISAMGAAGAIGLATGAAGMAWGATKWAGAKGGSLAARATGANRAAQGIGNVATRIGESMGLVARGTTASRQEGRLEEARKRVGHMQSSQLAALANKRAWTADERMNKAAAIEALYKGGNANLITNRQGAVAYAAGYGVKHDVFKGNPEDATYNTREAADMVRRGESPNLAAARATLRQRAYRSAGPEALSKMALHDGAQYDDPNLQFLLTNTTNRKLRKLEEQNSWHGGKARRLQDQVAWMTTQRDLYAPGSSEYNTWNEKIITINNMSIT